MTLRQGVQETSDVTIRLSRGGDPYLKKRITMQSYDRLGFCLSFSIIPDFAKPVDVIYVQCLAVLGLVY